MKMQLIHNSEQYTDKGGFATMTRMTVVKLDSIAGHLCRNAEELMSSANPSTTDDCRIARTMLGWAYSLAPLRIGTRFDY
jgi:hypothetical protein